MDMKNTNPRQDGRLSVARYIIYTQPSCEAASYTVKKLVPKKKGVNYNNYFLSNLRQTYINQHLLLHALFSVVIYIFV